MLEIVMTVICIVLLFNLVTAMVVLGRRSQDNSWLLALLLTGTTGAAVAALVAISVSNQPARFVDLSLILMGLASLPVVMRMMLSRNTADQDGDHAP